MRAPPWAFTLQRTCGCSHHPHRVSAHTLSSPRGIGILAPAPRRDQSAGEATHASDPPYMGIVLRSGGVCVRVNVRFVWGAFVSCCFACGCVLELDVCRVRFARVSCPRFRFAPPPTHLATTRRVQRVTAPLPVALCPPHSQHLSQQPLRLRAGRVGNQWHCGNGWLLRPRLRNMVSSV